MIYESPSQEVIDAIEGMFDCDKVRFWTVSDTGYYIETENMYNYARFKEGSVLMNFLKIAQMLGVDDGDEISQYSQRGCSTCDWGSKYVMELRFWNTNG